MIIREGGRAVKRRLVLLPLVSTLPLLGILAVLYRQVDVRAQVDEARRVDAIVVLGCSVWPGGRPSPALYARTEHAIELYWAGYASHLILTGGVGQNPPAESEVMRRLATAAGVPVEALLLDESSHSTERTWRTPKS